MGDSRIGCPDYCGTIKLMLNRPVFVSRFG